MNAPPLAHETFLVETIIDALPSRVFAAYADVRAPQDWSAPANDAIVYDMSEFRTGGTDVFRCGPKNDLRFHGAVVYHDIVPNERFVFVESIRTRDRTLSVAVVTWELLPEGGGTRLRATTQMISLAGPDLIAGAKSGTRAALNNLAKWLSQATSPR
jgi:uncharacterized protein YndB with AHSA1/START domain